MNTKKKGEGMSCPDCKLSQRRLDDGPPTAYYRWKNTEIAIIACRLHLQEIFAVLSDYQFNVLSLKKEETNKKNA